MMSAISRRIVLLLISACLAAVAESKPQRIISLAPSTTEILYGVGAFPRVKAVSQYCSYPPEVSKLPRVGDWPTSSIERIVALRPDLVVLTEPQLPFVADRLRAFGLTYVAVPSASLNDIFVAITRLGKATGDEQQATALIARTRAALDAVRNATSHLPRRSVLLSVNRTPGTLSELYAATEGSYLIDLVNIAGGRCPVAPERTGYGKVSKEAILSLNPEIIIDLVASAKSTLGEHATSTLR